MRPEEAIRMIQKQDAEHMHQRMMSSHRSGLNLILFGIACFLLMSSYYLFLEYEQSAVLISSLITFIFWIWAQGTLRMMKHQEETYAELMKALK